MYLRTFSVFCVGQLISKIFVLSRPSNRLVGLLLDSEYKLRIVQKQRTTLKSLTTP